MIFREPEPPAQPLREAIRQAHRVDESEILAGLADGARLSGTEREETQRRAAHLVEVVRHKRRSRGTLDAFLNEYELSSREGVLLMCLAEALLRIPDAETANRLIRDKVGGAEWDRHMGHSSSLLVNASTWGLMLTGRVVQPVLGEGDDWRDFMAKLVARSGEPVIRQAMVQAMRIMGRQFVMGRTIEEALERAGEEAPRGYRHSFDMLGEAARTMVDAERYREAYGRAIEAIGRAATGDVPAERPGISVKLSALHPRYEYAQRGRMLAETMPALKALAVAARTRRLGFCIDAEEADRLDLSLDLVEALALDPDLDGWDGFGLAVQAYDKRAPALIDWLGDLAGRSGRRLMVRLVKGAYWDSEIKRGQEGGHRGYPVYTRKVSTDVSYLACARRLLDLGASVYPQFATHNAHTAAAVKAMAGARQDYEFQRLHGMGEALYDELLADAEVPVACRVYAPVGSHEDLLAYLVRRLLENGANTSFVNRIFDEALPLEAIIADPVETLAGTTPAAHPAIPPPPEIYGPERLSAAGVDLADPLVLAPLAEAMTATVTSWEARPLIGGEALTGRPRRVFSPADRRIAVGEVWDADADAVARAHEVASKAAPDWDRTPAAARAAALRRAADLYEAATAELMTLCVREAGKTLDDAVAELREAVDFLRYYAARAEAEFAAPTALPGPTGEANEIHLAGRGVFACISPWNFPLAIFTGQVAAALAAGNAVIAKPAEQTSLIAMRAVGLLHQAGIPAEVLNLLPGAGEVVGAGLVADPRIAGVAFTGATETARAIQQALAARPGPIAPLVAETGGQNAMLVDSSALPEQVVEDVITSAFRSAGQRCSALRVLFLQDDVWDKVVTMLTGAMAELTLGDPAFLSTDVGPVIDADARQMLLAHAARMRAEARLLYETPLPPDCAEGTFVAPMAFEIDRLARLEREVFGPILHLVRYSADRLDAVVDQVNATGYGLTFAIHSRIDETVARVTRRLRVGNVYVNRNMIGAVVGVQPFGGEGLSGTGPKAGGPRYLHRFATERVVSRNTAAVGGNAALLAMADDDAAVD
ncbi:MAG: bifunctional proline dehydrogenase/L-glutamate gamma-semialdehyde dehydrogenase PutA [Alphaproteobacteria bacterium]|jgi:RHH-type proline utilization regulon transcriptional repressor/proline dehydrogenase/delta 1-pyrroline-5-carboxylate dehydrogenase|nr:bifunctional proline dehydrogenase/L-glutamate gamma-semialdehyde dehydrogenase PutA [Alphaproteobacteria bacterium]